MIERIVGAVIVVIVALLVGVGLYGSSLGDMRAEQDLIRQSYERDYTDLLIESLLMSYENESGLTYEALLVRSLDQLETSVTVGDRQVDVEERFAYAFDRLVGPENYYFTIRPAPKGLSVSYVLDGTPTMQVHRDYIRDSIPLLGERLREEVGLADDAALYMHVYIMESDEQADYCAGFASTPDVELTCEEVTATSLYTFLATRGYEPPIIAPFGSYEEWEAGSHHPDMPSFLASSDWASTASYASYKYREDDLERLQTNRHIVVTVADELTSSSKADSCFNLTDAIDWRVCIVCDGACPVRRAEGLVNQTRDILVENGDVFIGFYPFPSGGTYCNYEYSTSLTGIRISEYICKFIKTTNPGCAGFKDTDTYKPPADTEWCDYPVCSAACRPAVAPADTVGEECGPDCYCFHQNCNAALEGHLGLLAAASGGDAHTLTDLGDLVDDVVDYLNATVVSYDFEIGVRDDSRRRYVAERRVHLAGGKSVEVMFWVYE